LLVLVTYIAKQWVYILHIYRYRIEISPNYQLLVNLHTKELKALVDIGTSLGYTGEDLKQWLNDERMRIDREKEKCQEEEKKRQEEDKKRAFELEKLKFEAEAERAKIEAEQRRQEFELCGSWKWSMI